MSTDRANDTGHYPVSYSDEDPLRPIRCNCGDGWPCTRNEPTSEAPTSPPCRSVLMIGGADFPCDWPTDDRGKHPGWAHANKNCQAIWGKGNKPNTTLYDGQARERAERRNCTCPPGGIDPECHGPAEASSQATTYELAYGRGYEDGVEQEKANQVGTLTLPGEGSEVLVDGTRYRVHLEPITTGKTVVVEEPRFGHQIPGHGKWWQLMHAEHTSTGPVFSCPFCHPKRSLVEAVEVHRAWCAEHDIEPDTLRKLTEDRHDVIIGVRRNAVLAEQVAQASAEELNAELARRGWKLAFDTSSQSGPETVAANQEERRTIIEELTEAIRLTVEYVGTATLAAEPGWAWYDALAKYCPSKQLALRQDYLAQPDRVVLLAAADGKGLELTLTRRTAES